MELIQTAADCNINKYLACKFSNKYHVLMLNYSGNGTELDITQLQACIAAFENIDTEFTDNCGFQIPEINMMRNIYSKECRNKAIEYYLFVQFECVNQTGEPLFEGFKHLEKHQYILQWNGDKQNFISQLSRIKARESRHAVSLRMMQKELEDFRKLQDSNPTTNSSRKEFISMINHIQKAGFQVSFELTSMEQLGVLWSDFAEMQKSLMEQAEKGRLKR